MSKQTPLFDTSKPDTIILNSALNLCYGTTRYISYGYSVVSVDEAPMEEIWVYQTWKTLE